MSHPREEVLAAVDRLDELMREAARRNEWTFLVDELYTDDCVYTVDYGGTGTVRAVGREEIRQTHFGRDMTGFEGWTFPIVARGVDGDEIITHWLNRGPGTRPDGSYYETDGVSFITYAGGGRFCRQVDMFDVAAQMRLCDELDEAGLLSATLREQWVRPMKRRLIEHLSRNLD